MQITLDGDYIVTAMPTEIIMKKTARKIKRVKIRK